MIEKSSQVTVWLQFNMRSLTEEDYVPLTRFAILADTRWRSETRTLYVCKFYRNRKMCSSHT